MDRYSYPFSMMVSTFSGPCFYSACLISFSIFKWRKILFYEWIFLHLRLFFLYPWQQKVKSIFSSFCESIKADVSEMKTETVFYIHLSFFLVKKIKGDSSASMKCDLLEICGLLLILCKNQISITIWKPKISPYATMQ